MSKGMVDRKYLNRHNMTKIAVTADFSQGASGGPVVNNYGEVVGVVSATYFHYTNGFKKGGDLRMLIKEEVPARGLDNYDKKVKALTFPKLNKANHKVILKFNDYLRVFNQEGVIF